MSESATNTVGQPDSAANIRDITHVAVIGAGQMGNGIAHVFAAAIGISTSP